VTFPLSTPVRYFVCGCYVFAPLKQQPKAGQAGLILEVSRLHRNTRHIRWDSSRRGISPSHRLLRDNTEHLPETHIRAPCGIRTGGLSKRESTDRRLKPLSYGEWELTCAPYYQLRQLGRSNITAQTRFVF
jgi:hypothetical protein